ncbi:four-carbon acid sugar kinase family protein [Saliphagus infecundisoli]|uniref:Four-carbon acid sugar kinase family protein n=1 Tax=Saliphagus infecundisoli TaxID=1849069 RepID=A0ABD5QL18_9EURY|nr:four-carbon acid sugar kinase family protein [Saliphagus infecundisoli]
MEVLLVADDLTGAVDAGHGFARRGHRTVVAVSERDIAPDADDPAVLAVNTDSRYAEDDDAREAVARALGGREARVVYKKVDSTLRGNVASEVEAAIEASDADLAVVAPAFPAAGRTTREGIHRVEGRRLSETGYADDANPPGSDRLPALFEQARYPVEHVPLETVAEGVGAIHEVLESSGEGPRIATFDAADDGHLATIARAGGELGERVLYVGSGGLAAHIAVPERGVGVTGGAVGSPDGSGVLAVVGSVADATLAGIERVPDSTVIELDGEELVAEPERVGRAAGERAAARLARGEHALVTAARSRADVAATRGAGARAGHDENEVAARVRRALAAAAGVALAEGRPSGLFLTGGDVALAVCEEVGIDAIRLSGEAVAEGVPCGRVAGGPLSGTPLVTKAGGFGGESTIVTVLGRLDGGS